jgi:nucleotide-binding universal stress UspA family protein
MKGSKILVATDLSKNAAFAARWAVDASARLGLPVALVHVLDITVKSWKGEFDVLADPALRSRAVARLEQWFEEHTERKPDEVLLDVGSPADRIARMCKDHDPALLVLSISGKGAWNRFIFGSTALRLTHVTPCPLVLVHPEHERLPERPRMAVGTDFTPPSDRAVAFAGDLARRLDAHVDLVHASALPTTTVILDTELPVELASTAVVHQAEEAMERFAQAHGEDLKGLHYASHVVTDHPARGLLEFVDQHGIDLLVLGHYRTETSALGRIGSVMVKTVQQSRTTVLIVPGDHKTS